MLSTLRFGVRENFNWETLLEKISLVKSWVETWGQSDRRSIVVREREQLALEVVIDDSGGLTSNQKEVDEEEDELSLQAVDPVGVGRVLRTHKLYDQFELELG